MNLAEFKKYADKRAPFPSSTANAGFPGCAAGVRRGRSGTASSAGEATNATGNGCVGGTSAFGVGYGGGYGDIRGEAISAGPSRVARRELGGEARESTADGAAAATGGVSVDLGESEVAKRVRMFWRSLGPNTEAPLYGADTLGTLFAEEDDDSWNVGRLVSSASHHAL